MTAREIFNQLMAMHPHQHTEDELLFWLNRLEHDLCYFLNHFRDEKEEFVPHADADEELLTDAYDCYIFWLYARICESNEEYDRYSAQAALYASALDDWKSEYISLNKPVSKGRHRNLL